jgi:hypothetical protein
VSSEVPQELLEELWRCDEEIDRLNKQIAKMPRDDPGRKDVFFQRRQLIERYTALLFSYHDQSVDEELHSEEITADLGFVSSVVQFLVKVRHELGKELQRDDLTPYLWSVLRKRHEGLSYAIGALHGKRSQNVEVEPVPTHVLTAEFDDGSLEWTEAYDEEEAKRLEQEFVDDGAVVYRFACYPEFGSVVYVHTPVRNLDNRHRPMTETRYRQLVRLKGSERFKLPDEMRRFVVDAERRYSDEELDLDEDE